MKIRIAIADDHAIVRDGIRLMTKTETDFEFVFEAENGTDFLKLLQLNHVDIAILDVQMPDMTGLELASLVINENNHCRVLIFSALTDEKIILDAVNKGVAGYISKDASLIEVKNAINTVFSGEQYFSMKVGEVLYKSFLRKKDGLVKMKTDLTAREEDVLKGFAEGLSYKEIADKLFISPRTVETHKENIMKKLGLNTLADLIKYAIKNGIIELE
ncbi:MAG: response regulator transcription factor [Bacteroidales bacterium]|nr:response regulator transcription factor [Bacteroidales bacterium]